MSREAKTISSRYKKLLDQGYGAVFCKVDLHVHTPASGDAQAKNKYNYKFRMDDPSRLQSARQLAEKIVKRCTDEKIRLMAITDHNSPSNTDPEDLTNSWYQLIREASKKKNLCVLPGVEISTDDLHILVILDPKDEPAVYATHRINFLLRDCKFTPAEYGDFRATGMSSLFDVIQYVEELGTSCIAIPAHIDGGKKAMLKVYKGPSNVFNKLLNHPNLNAVEVVKHTTPARKKMGGKKGKPLKDYFAGLRDPDRSPIAYIQNSDGHSVKEIGKEFRSTYVRMGEPGFWSLKNALEDPETRIRLESNYKLDEDKTKLIGIAFREGRGKWDYIAFNQDMNCIIGKRRTRKSTIINLILYGLDRFKENEKEEEKLIEGKYSVNVFIRKGPNVLCYSRGKDGKPPTLFRLEDNSFVPSDGRIRLELPRKYNHEAAEELFSKKTSLMDFLDRHIFTDKKIQSYRAKRDKYMEKAKEKGFEKKSDIKSLTKACERLFKEREKHLKSALEKYGKKSGKNIFKVKVKEGKREGKREEDFIDKADMYMLVKSKYKHLNKLSTGEKNAAIMVLLMNQGAFGPLIIDEPEQYLDVSAITGMLVPRMRKLKTRQQIICVTNNEHILLSGDAEQVIATQSERNLKVATGDINNEGIQKRILEIFEGDRPAMVRKIRKLGSVLE